MAQKTGGVTIAFLGTGAMDVDNATDLIEEFIESAISSDDEPVRFVFPLTTDEFSDTLTELVDMARQSDITYEVVTSTADKGRRSFTEISNAAARTYHVADVYTQIEAILTEAPSSILEVLWDKEREEELSEIVGKFIDAGIEVKDLTDGNTPIAADGEEVPEETPTEVEPEAPEEGTTEEAEVLYTESQLMALNRAEVKEIAARLGLPPRRSSAAMIEEIMEAQNASEEEGGEEQPAEVAAEPVIEVDVVTGIGSGELVEALDAFPGRLHEVLDEFLTNLAKTIEGIIFNATPEEQAPPARRLTRAR
jgi:hypothetical protein